MRFIPLGPQHSYPCWSRFCSLDHGKFLHPWPLSTSQESLTVLLAVVLPKPQRRRALRQVCPVLCNPECTATTFHGLNVPIVRGTQESSNWGFSPQTLRLFSHDLWSGGIRCNDLDRKVNTFLPARMTALGRNLGFWAGDLRSAVKCPQGWMRTPTLWGGRWILTEVLLVIRADLGLEYRFFFFCTGYRIIYINFQRERFLSSYCPLCLDTADAAKLLQ